MGQANNRHSQRGFTVQEMLLVLLISVILLSLSLVGIVTAVSAYLLLFSSPCSSARRSRTSCSAG